MIKREVHYTDFNNEEQTENFYFHISVPEALELSWAHGDVSETLSRLQNSRKVGEIFGIIQEIVMKAVGQKSDDGKRFVKNDAIRADFKESPAYEAFMMKLLGDEKFAGDFFQDLLPAKEMREELEKRQSNKHPMAMERKNG